MSSILRTKKQRQRERDDVSQNVINQEVLGKCSSDCADKNKSTLQKVDYGSQIYKGRSKTSASLVSLSRVGCTFEGDDTEQKSGSIDNVGEEGLRGDLKGAGDV